MLRDSDASFIERLRIAEVVTTTVVPLSDTMTASMENKMAIVTGGGSGIGRAASLIYAREGAKVVIADVASGVRINVISPGLITVKATHDRDWAKELRIPMGRPGKFEEVGELAVFLSSSRASYITGQTIRWTAGRRRPDQSLMHPKEPRYEPLEE